MNPDDLQPEQSPVETPRRTPVKPLRIGPRVGIALILIVLLIIFLNFFSSFHLFRTQGQGTPLPTTMTPAEVAANKRATDSQIARHGNKTDDLIGDKAKPAPPDESAKTDHLIRTHGQQRGTGQPVVSEAAKRRKAALESSSAGIDFSEKEQEAKSESPKPETPPVLPASVSAPPPAQPPQPTALSVGCGYTGKLHTLPAGTTIIEAVLLNRLIGDYTGPVRAMSTGDTYSWNHQHIEIPQGTLFAGKSNRVGERIAVSFDSAIMPDKCGISLDNFTGLDQIGASALRDIVNHHWLRAFGFSIALGGIAGLSQIGNSTTGFGYDPSVTIRAGISQQVGEEAVQILDRLTNVAPDVIIRERTPIRIWLAKDLQLPEYANHVVDLDP